jgi:hypothetical protein
MKKNRIIWIAITSAFVVSFLSAGAQSWAASGLYQIISGSYSACCGFGGDFRSALPSTSQTFVSLAVDPQSHVATMTFLGEDARTVFSIVPCPSEDSINFAFVGFVLSDGTMVFHVDPFPPPDEYYYYYTVSNSANSLRIDGTLVAHRSACADVPDHFAHSNVVAVLVTPPAIDRIERDGNSIRFHLTGPQLYDYTVEFTDSLTAPNWQASASYRAKLGPIDVVVTNSLTSAQARFFRVRQEFCFCRNE